MDQRFFEKLGYKICCVFGHKWNGCKCSKCGKTRDEACADVSSNKIDFEYQDNADSDGIEIKKYVGSAYTKSHQRQDSKGY